MSDWFDGAVERAQQAMHDLARQRVEEVPSPDWDDAAAFFVSLAVESDRALPILAFTFIDSEIERSLRNALNGDVSGGLDDLFGPMGPLGSASSKINLSNALFWLSDNLTHDLHVLRKIRNLFAHDRMRMGMDDQRTNDLLKNHKGLLPTISALLNHPDIDFDSGIPQTINTVPPLHFNTRNRLIFASALTAWRCMAELYVAPLSLRSAVSPAVLLDHKSPTAPVGIVAQRDAFEGFIDGLLWVATSPTHVAELPPSGERVKIGQPISRSQDDDLE